MLLSTVHMKGDRSNCVRSEKREFERLFKTLLILGVIVGFGKLNKKIVPDKQLV